MSEPVEGEQFTRDDWYGEQWSMRSYVDCTFVGVDLTEAEIVGCSFTGCTFRDVRFNASHVRDCALTNCTFEGSNLFDAEFTACKLTGSSFVRCATRPLRVLGGDWSFVSLAHADLGNCVFRGVRMREADLRGANCTKGVLAECDLSAATFDKAVLVRADLRGSDLTALDPLTTDLSEAMISAEQAVVLVQAMGLIVG
ncbi:MAG TPA: pentapeptide repeat-containing protein [Jatrophihabitantaceae bacterium]